MRQKGVFTALAVLCAALLLTFFAGFFSHTVSGGAMRPSLLPGDSVLVSRLAYGVRLPLMDKPLFTTGKPAYGDIIVFDYPPDPAVRMNLRVVALPGDRLDYRSKQLIINGRKQAQTPLDERAGSRPAATALRVYEEVLPGRRHMLLLDTALPAFDLMKVATFHERGWTNFPDNCRYDVEQASWFQCTVPAAHYLVLGDNRDASIDGRYWGFVPETGIRGKVLRVWKTSSAAGQRAVALY